MHVDATAYSTAEALVVGWTSDCAGLIDPTLIAIAFLLGTRSWRPITRDTTGRSREKLPTDDRKRTEEQIMAWACSLRLTHGQASPDWR